MDQLSFTSAQFQTPIEEKLKIDESGMTTARALYAFLELSPTQFSRWAKTQIENNKFYDEGQDWIGFDIVSNGNLCKDYKLSTDFAKHLAMESKSKKGKEARQYFIDVEQNAKGIITNIMDLSSELQLSYSLLNAIAKQEMEQKRQAQEIIRINKRIDSVKETFNPVSDNWRKDTAERISKIQQATGADIRFIRSDLYNELENRARVNLSIRLRNKKRNATEAGSSRSRIENINYMDVIEEDAKLREIFSGIIKDFEVKHCF